MAQEKHKTDFDDHRLKRNKMRQETIIEENKIIMMDPDGMDEKAKGC